MFVYKKEAQTNKM